MMLAGGVSLLLVPNFGWQSAFFAGILPAGLIWFFRLGIPEFSALVHDQEPTQGGRGPIATNGRRSGEGTREEAAAGR